MSDDEIRTEETLDPLDVKLTHEQNIRIVEHINRKAVSPDDACVVCGSRVNHVVESTYAVATIRMVPSVGGTYMPLIATVCHDCGFVRFFNKIIVDNLVELHSQETQGTLALNGD